MQVLLSQMNYNNQKTKCDQIYQFQSSDEPIDSLAAGQRSQNRDERCSNDHPEDHMWCNVACITLYLPQLMTVSSVSPASTSQLLWGNVVCQAQYGVSACNNGRLVLPGWHHCHSSVFFFFLLEGEGFVDCRCFCYCCFGYMSRLSSY